MFLTEDNHGTDAMLETNFLIGSVTTCKIEKGLFRKENSGINVKLGKRDYYLSSFVLIENGVKVL